MATTTITVRANPRDSFDQRELYTLNLGTLGQAGLSSPIMGITTDGYFHYLLSDSHTGGGYGSWIIKVDPATGVEVDRATGFGIDTGDTVHAYDIEARKVGDVLHFYVLWYDQTDYRIEELTQVPGNSMIIRHCRTITFDCKDTARHITVKGGNVHVTSNYWFGSPGSNITHDIFRIADGDRLEDQAYAVVGTTGTEAGVTFDGAFFIHKLISPAGDPQPIHWATTVNWVDFSIGVGAIWDSHNLTGADWATDEKYSITYDGYNVLDFESQAS